MKCTAWRQICFMESLQIMEAKMAKTIDQVVAQVLANVKTGYQCHSYPMPDSNFSVEKMDASKAAGVKGPAKSAKRQGPVKDGGLTL